MKALLEHNFHLANYIFLWDFSLYKEYVLAYSCTIPERRLSLVGASKKHLFWNTYEVIIIPGVSETVSRIPWFQTPHLMVKAVKRILTKIEKALLRPWISGFFHRVCRMACLSKKSHTIGSPVPCLQLLLSLTLIVYNVSCACFASGILKFNEHYLGENTVENSSDFQASSSATLPTATGSALEHHIASVREALGVESHYSR